MRLASVRGRTADDIALQGVIWSVLRPLQPTVEHSLATLPTSTIPFVVGLAGLLLSGAGMVFSAYQTLNHVVAVRHRLRASLILRYVRVFVVLATLMIAPLLARLVTEARLVYGSFATVAGMFYLAILGL